jgi:transcriptional antiterminator RfaH
MEFALNTFLTAQWYVVHCKTGREIYTAKVLKDLLGITIYLPEISVISRKGRKESFPFFPGYLFAQVNLEEVKLNRINSSPGVLKMLDFGCGPQPVPESLISTIQEMLSRINRDNLPHHNLSPGDVVRVKNGPFQGLEAIFVGTLTSNERVQILLHFLGRLSKTQVNLDQLEKIKASPSPPTGRRTRGKGRRIRQATNSMTLSRP